MSKLYVLDPLVTGESLRSELRNRSKSYYETTIPHNKVTQHEDKGWYVLRQNKNTCRLRLDKTPQEALEDEIWTLLA